MPASAKNATTKKPTVDRDKLIADLKILIEDARALTGEAADSSQEFLGEKVSEIQTKIKDSVDMLKEHGETVKEKGKESFESVENLIKENPWKALGIAVAAGILIDRLIRD